MNGHRVRPSPRALGSWAPSVLGIGIVLVLLVPTGLLGATATAPTLRAPLSGSVPVSVELTRAALHSLTDAGPRIIVPDPWHNISPRLNLSPSAREGEALVYDPADGYVLLFGGATGAGAVHDTWKFSNGHWTNLTSNLTRMPPSRYKAMVSYDAADGYVVLFGGRASVYLNDTWKWQNGAWSPINTAAAPSAREDAMMSYDPADGYTLLFGGENQANHLLNDTWSFVGGTWTNLTVNGALAPPTREAGGMAWDATDGYVVMFGGSNDPRGDLHDTWTYRAGTWTNRTNLSSATPSKRETLMLADDPVDGFVLLFGGLKFPTSIADSWAYTNGSWTLLAVGAAPSPRWGAQVTWDVNGGRGDILLFGGVSSPNVNATYLNDTWTFKVPLAANLSASGATTFDLGERTNLTISAQGGYPFYSYGWLGLPPGCPGANSTTLNCGPTQVGTYNVTAWVLDTAGANLTTSAVSLTIAALPTVSGTLTPVQGDAPLLVQYSTATSGGVGPFAYDWQFGDGGTSNVSAGAHTYSSAGNYTATLTIHDADGATATAPGIPTVSVKPGLTASIVASATSGIAPLTVDFSVDLTGGWTPYAFLWQLGPAGVTSSDAAPSYTFLTPGSYLVSANITDAVGASVVAFTNVTVNPVPPLTATVSASSTNGSVPLTVTFTGGASGGTGPYTFSWSFGDNSASEAGASVSHTYSFVGNYTATLTATDGTTASAQASVRIQVDPVPVVPVPFDATFEFQVGSPYCAEGTAVAAVTLTATATGGTAPYSFAWTIGATQATGPSLTVTVPAGATTALFLNATDSGGHASSVSHDAPVAALSCSSTSNAGSIGPNYLLLLLIGVVATVIGVEILLLVRRKRA